MLAFSAVFVRFVKGERQRRLLEYPVGIILGVGIFIVLVARTFLLVESFLSLRRVSEEAFQSVAWAHDWPHLG